MTLYGVATALEQTTSRGSYTIEVVFYFYKDHMTLKKFDQKFTKDNVTRDSYSSENVGDNIETIIQKIILPCRPRIIAIVCLLGFCFLYFSFALPVRSKKHPNSTGYHNYFGHIVHVMLIKQKKDRTTDLGKKSMIHKITVSLIVENVQHIKLPKRYIDKMQIFILMQLL